MFFEFDDLGQDVKLPPLLKRAGVGGGLVMPACVKDAFRFAELEPEFRDLLKVGVGDLLAGVDQPSGCEGIGGVTWSYTREDGYVARKRSEVVCRAANEMQMYGRMGFWFRDHDYVQDMSQLLVYVNKRYGITGYDNRGFMGEHDLFAYMDDPEMMKYEGKTLESVMDDLYGCIDDDERMVDLAVVDVRDAIRQLQESRELRKQDRGKDMLSKLYVGALRSENNTIVKFSHEGCPDVLHVGSGSQNCLSQHAFPGSIVECVDPVLDGRGYEDLEDLHVRKCVVSDIGDHDEWGLVDSTNVKVADLLSRVSDECHFIAKVCVADKYPAEFDKWNWKIRYKLRAHNREVVVERVKRGRSLYAIFMKVAQVIYHANRVRDITFHHKMRKIKPFRRVRHYPMIFPEMALDTTKLKGGVFMDAAYLEAQQNAEGEDMAVWFARNVGRKK
jgi:hypothetical protein